MARCLNSSKETVSCVMCATSSQLTAHCSMSARKHPYRRDGSPDAHSRARHAQEDDQPTPLTAIGLHDGFLHGLLCCSSTGV